ncbi:hypothetical protein PT974_10597 [Cladobotryum mycophilum]|uniref:Uncharacterized protein n=1 Tax=Cladobotryum mycophilum TaxID=491253 RepID=A0ABR0SAB4_9HYPO
MTAVPQRFPLLKESSLPQSFDSLIADLGNPPPTELGCVVIISVSGVDRGTIAVEEIYPERGLKSIKFHYGLEIVDQEPVWKSMLDLNVARSRTPIT